MKPRPRRHYGNKTCVAVEITERREPITRAFIGAMTALTLPIRTAPCWRMIVDWQRLSSGCAARSTKPGSQSRGGHPSIKSCLGSLGITPTFYRVDWPSFQSLAQ